MEAFLLAAGFGTRLGDRTRLRPKALMPIGGVPILEHIIRRLIGVGVDRIVINTHHLADQIEDFVRERGGFGIEILFSHEAEVALETGGGLKHAARLLRAEEPFFIHNTDILSDLPLDLLYRAHQEGEALATLAVMSRESSRYLLFDEGGLLGWGNERTGARVEARGGQGTVQRLGFAGVHVASPSLLPLLIEEGAFSIFTPYLRLSGAGHRIAPFATDAARWIDIGSPERLEEAEGVLREIERAELA